MANFIIFPGRNISLKGRRFNCEPQQAERGFAATKCGFQNADFGMRIFAAFGGLLKNVRRARKYSGFAVERGVRPAGFEPTTGGLESRGFTL